MIWFICWELTVGIMHRRREKLLKKVLSDTRDIALAE